MKLISILLLFNFFYIESDSQTINNDTISKVYTVAEKMPVFPGGYDLMMTYINSKTKSLGLTGIVYVSCIIKDNGKVTQVEIPGKRWSQKTKLEAEAIKIVESMPNWNPGVQNGNPVNVAYNIEIDFSNK